MTGTENDAADQLLLHVAAQVERARSSADPVERARIAASLQWYSGWALRFAVDECRAAGLSWPAIGEKLGIRQTTVFDQHRAGGPVIIARPHRSPGGRNDVWTTIWHRNGQTPLRQVATKLVHNAMSQDPIFQNTATARDLDRPIHAMGHAQTTTNSPEPLLRAVEHLLQVAAEVAARLGYPEAATSAQERAVWDTLAELAQVYERDKELIHVAAEVAGILHPGSVP